MITRAGFNVIESIQTHKKFRGNKAAFICDDNRVTWSEFCDGVNKVANALINSGLKKGDKVCLISLNNIEAAMFLFGAVRAGGVIVPLSALLSPEQMVSLLNDSKAKFVFASWPLMQQVALIPEGAAAVPREHRYSFGFEDEQWTPYEEFLDGVSSEDPNVTYDDEDEMNIIYSSGTTGLPKGIVHTHFARAVTANGLGLAFRINSAAVTILTTPLFTNGTWMTMLPTLLLGGTMVMLPAFSAEAFMKAVEKEKGTHTFMVPTQIKQLIEHPDRKNFDLSSLQILVSAGAALPLQLKKQVLDQMGTVLMELYGLTEGMATILSPEDVLSKTGSVGVPVAGSDMKIINDDGIEQPTGEPGEIVGLSAGLMKAYFNRPEATEEIIWKDERNRTFIRSGDMGKFDKDGYLYILDRKKDMIISGGINIYANDLEEVILQNDDVDDVAVIAIPDDKWGETPLALVIRHENATISEADLRTWANAKLAKHQRISKVVFREDDYPRNALGKVLKRQLREEYQSIITDK